MKNRGGKDQPGRDGHGESVVGSIPLMFHLRCLMKLTRDIHRSEGEQG